MNHHFLINFQRFESLRAVFTKHWIFSFRIFAKSRHLTRMGIVTCHLDDWELGYWPSRKDFEDYRLHYLCHIYILNTLTSFGWHRTVHSPTRRRVIFGESQKYCNLFDACQYKSFDTMENISGRMDPYQIGMRIKISPSVITTTQWIYVMLVFMSWWLLSQNPVCYSPQLSGCWWDETTARCWMASWTNVLYL